jgi:transglutaminase/protease-like cytokinesis protein 3
VVKQNSETKTVLEGTMFTNQRRYIACVLTVALLLSLFTAMTPVSASAKSAKTIYTEIAAKMLKRKKNFSIKCEYNKTVKRLVNKMNSNSTSKYLSALYDITHNSDKSSTTDDGDYLYGIIKQAGCYYSEGKLHFYSVKYFETAAQTKTVNVYTLAMAKQICKASGDTYEQIQLAYSSIIDTVKYDTRKNCFYSAYAGYVRGKTVCNGYALMLYKLLMQLGIPARFISGKIKDGGKWYSHAWNKVKYNGKWYNLDACSDDEDDGEVYQDFFMKSDKKYAATHLADSFMS